MCGLHVLLACVVCMSRLHVWFACLCTFRHVQVMRLTTLLTLLCRLVSYIQPARNKDLLDQLQQKKMTVLGEWHACLH